MTTVHSDAMSDLSTLAPNLEDVIQSARRNSLTRDNPLLADLPDRFQELRDHQRVAVREILLAYEEGAKCVVLDAPTGSGKSLIGEVSRRLLPDNRQTTYICSSKSLQDQVLREFTYAKVLKGRSNYATELYPERFGGRDGLSCADCTKTPGEPDSCMWCLTPGQKVLTTAGLIAIEDIRVNDVVISGDGLPHRVTQTLNRHYTGEVVSLRPYGGNTITCTPEHMILASQRHPLERDFSKLDKDWIPAGELRLGDVVWGRTADYNNASEYPDHMKALLGWYLAEGSVTGKHKRGGVYIDAPRSIQISLHDKELEYQEEVTALFRRCGIEHVVKISDPRSKSTQILVNNASLARWLAEMGGRGSHNKRIHPSMMMQGGNLLPLLRACWRGDGTEPNSTTKAMSFVVTSEELAHQIQTLLEREGIVGGWIARPARPGHRASFGIQVAGKYTDRLCALLGYDLPERKITPRKLGGEVYSDEVAHRVAEIYTTNYDGMVYDLTVEDAHSFSTVGPVTIHNCSSTHLCPYERAKHSALSSPLAVLNTSYFLSECNGPGRFSWAESNGYRSRLVIADEGDTVESELMGHVEVRISERRLKQYGLGVPRYVTKEESWREWAEEAYEKVKSQPPVLGINSTDIKAVRERKRHIILVEKLRELRAGLDSGKFIYTGSRDAVAFKPVTVDFLGQERLWRHGDKWLLMSATVISADELLESLGWPDDKEWRLVKVPSTFKPENRKVVVAPVANMSYKGKEEGYGKLIDAIVEIIRRHPDDRMLIHSTNYECTREIRERLEVLPAELRVNSTGAVRKLITYSESNQKESRLSDFLSSPSSIMIAPSMGRGVDLPGDACRVQVIAKVPFGNLRDKQISTRLYGTGREGKVWYAVNAIRTIVQMTGRAVRGPDDYAITYILDSQFVTNLWASNKRLFPEYWKEALEWRTKGL